MWKDAIYQIAMKFVPKAAKMWDVDGNEYIDFLMSFGIGLFGHTPDFVQKAVTEQMRKGNGVIRFTSLSQRSGGH